MTKSQQIQLLLLVLSLAVTAWADCNVVIVEIRDLLGNTITDAELIVINDKGMNVKPSVVKKDGQAELHNLSCGEYMIKVSSPGFASESRRMILSAETKLHIHFGLLVGRLHDTKKIRIYGMVKYSDGKPARSVRVLIAPSWNLRLHRSAVTDRMGRYELSVGHSGQYEIHARASDGISAMVVTNVSTMMPEERVDVIIPLLPPFSANDIP